LRISDSKITSTAVHVRKYIVSSIMPRATPQAGGERPPHRAAQLRVRAAAAPARFEVQCAESVAGVKSDSHGRELSVRVLSDAVLIGVALDGGCLRKGAAPAQVRTARIYAHEMVLCMRFHSEEKERHWLHAR
jgi:hypothetical protein